MGHSAPRVSPKFQKISPLGTWVAHAPPRAVFGAPAENPRPRGGAPNGKSLRPAGPLPGGGAGHGTRGACATLRLYRKPAAEASSFHPKISVSKSAFWRILLRARNFQPPSRFKVFAAHQPSMNTRSFIFAFISLGSFAFAAATAEPTKEQAEFFESKIRPILADNCYKCHSIEKGKAKGELTMDTREGLLKGGENGKVIEPGDPQKSPMIKAVTYLDKDLQMPPKGEKLTDAQIALLTEWVKMGAPDPRKDAATTKAKLSGLTDRARGHWAYQPIVKPPIPQTKNHAWPRTPVDAFILAKLEEKNMVPAPDAEKGALLRRATFDLIGLPPTPQEVQAFVNDTMPQAFAKVVDRLLAPPRYGAR